MKHLFIALLLPLILISACVCPANIGGNKDEHGCLTAAGYTWCESKAKCLRIWEEECKEIPQSRARFVAINYIRETEDYIQNNGRNMKILDVTEEECEGCWVIQIQYDADSETGLDAVKVSLSISNWEVTNTDTERHSIMSEQECESYNGKVQETNSDCIRKIGVIASLDRRLVCCTQQ
jgi:hypothetical protein